MTTLASWSTALAERDGGERRHKLSGAKEPASRNGMRFREGSSLVNQAGAFQLVSDRVVFTFEGDGRQLTVLENLALERVARAVRQASSSQTWLVSGVVTEYQGSNFLLLERAVIRRAAPDVRASR